MTDSLGLPPGYKPPGLSSLPENLESRGKENIDPKALLEASSDDIMAEFHLVDSPGLKTPEAPKTPLAVLESIGSSQPVATPPVAISVAAFATENAESNWRANDKYKQVRDCMQQGIAEVIKKYPELQTFHDSLETTAAKIVGQREPPRGATAEQKCQFYAAKALSCLSDLESFKNERDAYKEYKHSFRTALASAGSDSAKITVRYLNMLAYVEHTQVHVESFTGKIATEWAAKGGFTKKPSSDFKTMLQEVMPFYKAVGNKSEVGQSLRGVTALLGFDPTVQGNPVNVKFKAHAKDGREVVNVRTPTPTGGDGKVTPEFKAFLRHLKSEGQKYTMINLQNRKGALVGEKDRSNNLEALAKDPEFKNVIEVFTLDKNSAFYEQKNSGMVSADFFISRQFLPELFNPESGFHLPEAWKSGSAEHKEMEQILRMVHRTVFDGKPKLDQKERQDFIEVAYIFLADYFIKKTEADFYNESCKDCIDRGGGANWTMMAFMTLLETYDSSRKASEATLEDRISALPAKFQEDAIWARKRGAISERVERAETAMARLAEKAGQHCREWMEQMHFEKIDVRL